MKIIGNRVISIAECLFIDKQDSSVTVIHARQHEAGQENAVTFSVYCYERYEKRYGFVHVLSDARSDVLKPTMSIDAPGTIRGTVEWSIPLEKSLLTN